MIRLHIRSTLALVLVALAAVLGVLAWKMGLVPAAAPHTINVTVVGHSWWWEIVYPDYGIKTANELHVPAGSEIHLQLTSVDVLHTLRIPELSIEAQALPGQVNNTRMRLERPGGAWRGMRRDLRDCARDDAVQGIRRNPGRL